jgi:quercetin dioxygenase-like cupin family protein
MEEAMKQIGERLRGLREIMDLEVSELANLCGVSEERYLKIERGEADITISNLMKIARRCGVSADVLMFGEEPHMKSYYVTRRGQGLSVERTKAYKYESLTSGFQNRKANAFIVTVEPKPDATKIYKNSHSGQEFNYVLEGTMELHIGEKVIRLGEGDSIYFESTTPHGMKAIGDKPVRFVAVAID